MNTDRVGASKGDILIVDDTPNNLRFLSTMLSKHGYDVRKATSGSMALRSVEVELPDLILLDIKMPGIDGYAVCQQLKASETTHEVPVIFLSAMNDVLDKVKAFEVGGVDYITKPFQFQEVLVRVENQLTIRRQQKQLALQNAVLQQQIAERLAVEKALQHQNVLLQQEIGERQRAEAALQKANHELVRLASLDGLTRVANRRRFDEYLHQYWQRLARERALLSLILCDVDYFKPYNDTYGHQAGDDCLKQVAIAIATAVKRREFNSNHSQTRLLEVPPLNSGLVARYGGEEFAVILPYTSTEEAVSVAETIRQDVQNLHIPHARSTVSQYVTLSLGVTTTIPSEEFPPEFLTAVADKALYEAKDQGRDRHCVHAWGSHPFERLELR